MQICKLSTLALLLPLSSGCGPIQVYLDALMPTRAELNKIEAGYALDALCDMTVDGKARQFTPGQVGHIDALCVGAE